MNTVQVAIPGPELIVGLCIFSASPFSIAYMLSSIEYFGDHVLGCSHDPMRTHWHDALVDINSGEFGS